MKAREKTLVLADLHLGTTNTHDIDTLVPWIKVLLTQSLPTRLVLAGDIFETILPMEHGQPINNVGVTTVVRAIVATWQELFSSWNESSVQEVTFLSGEHDAEIATKDVRDVLRRSLPSKRVTTEERWYDEGSDSLIVHGHQFDYNRIFWSGSERVSCVDGLTVAINALLSQSPGIETRVRDAAEAGIFSYWYAFGELPRFINAVERIFFAKASTYEAECARMLLGGDLDRWLGMQSDLLTRACGQVVKLAAHHPPTLLRLYDAFYRLLDLHVKWRMKKVLAGHSYQDEPETLKISGGVRNLVFGHFHEPRMWHDRGRSGYGISCPRLSVAGIENECLRTFRDLSYVLLDGPDVSLHHKRILRLTPLEQFK